MSKASNQQGRQIGGFDETYLDNLPDPNDPSFLEKFIEAVKKPIKIVEDDEE